MTVLLPDNPLAYTMAGVRRSNPFDARRRYAQQMVQAGSDTSPVQHPLQGAARLAQALVGGWMGGQVEQQEQEALKTEKADAEKKLAMVMAEPDPEKRIQLAATVDPKLGLHLTGQLAVKQAEQASQRKNLETAATGFGQIYAPPSGQANTAIASIESAGLPNNGYGAVGRPADAKGSRAHGRYQIMDYNIGPWTQEVLGRAMSPQEFLANSQAQDAVFNAKFNQYVKQYGSPEAAARAWFAGPGGMNNPGASDVNGMTVQRYGQKFAQAYGPGATLPQGSADGMPPAPSPQAVNGPVLQAPAVPETPRPTPTPQQIAQYQQRLMTGEFGNDQGAASRARAALEAELDRDWQVRRDQDKMRFTQETEAYKDQRDRNQPSRNEVEKLQAARSDAAAIVSALDDFNREFKNTGTWGAIKSVAGYNTPVNTAYNAAALLAKGEQLFHLGVLNGPDLEIIRRTLPDPSTFKGAQTSAADMQTAVNKVVDLLQTRLGAREKQLGLPVTNVRQFAAEVRGATPQSPDAPPAATSFVGPDGRVVSMADIEETARNRGMDPAAVIQRLQLRAVR